MLPGPSTMTHLWQPADVGLVKVLKDRYQQHVVAYNIKTNCTPLTEKMAIKLMQDAWETVTPSEVMQYWVRSGLLKPPVGDPRTKTRHRWVMWDHAVPFECNPDTIRASVTRHPFSFSETTKQAGGAADPCADDPSVRALENDDALRASLPLPVKKNSGGKATRRQRQS